MVMLQDGETSKMVKIYVTTDKDGYITGYGKAEYGTITEDPKDSIMLDIPKSHPILSGDLQSYKLINGELTNNPTKALDDKKSSKLSELSNMCYQVITSGFVSTVASESYVFSYDKEAQVNLTERWNLFQNEMIDEVTLTARETTKGEKVRVKVNKKQFEVIYMDSVKHKEDCISRLHDVLMPMVKNAVTLNQVDNIKWENTIVYPVEPSIVIKDDKTLNKQVEGASKKADRASQSTDLNSMALMEFMNMLVSQNNI